MMNRGRHSGAEQSEEPGIQKPGAGGMDSGLAAARRSGMTNYVFSSSARTAISASGVSTSVKAAIPVSGTSATTSV
jgi:hypothetical protein